VYNWVRKEVKGDCRQYSGLRGGRGGFKARMILELPEWEGGLHEVKGDLKIHAIHMRYCLSYSLLPQACTNFYCISLNNGRGKHAARGLF